MPRPATAESLNQLTSRIIASAVDVHRALGPGLLESAYLACLTHDLRTHGVKVEQQRPLALTYRDLRIDCAYRPDLIVDDAVIVEVKALDALAPVHSRQLYTYLRLADCRVGLILNFGAQTMKSGIKRIVNRFPE